MFCNSCFCICPKIHCRGHPKLVVDALDANARTWYGRNSLPEGRHPQALETKRHDRYVAKTKEHIRVVLPCDPRTGEEICGFANGAWA